MMGATMEAIPVRACPSRLRIMPSAQESGRISSFHHRARRFSDDSTPIRPPARIVRQSLRTGGCRKGSIPGGDYDVAADARDRQSAWVRSSARFFAHAHSLRPRPILRASSMLRISDDGGREVVQLQEAGQMSACSRPPQDGPTSRLRGCMGRQAHHEPMGDMPHGARMDHRH